MDDLRKQYQRERKRARDRLYRARKKGYEYFARDLPEIPSVITEADIEILKDISQGVLESIRIEKELEAEEEKQISEDLREFIAPKKEVVRYSIFDALYDKISDLENKLRSTNFLGAKDGMVVIGKTSLPRDTEQDKADIIQSWKNILDDATQSPESARDLYEHIVNTEEDISGILNDLETVTYMLYQYQIHLGALESLINYQAPSIEASRTLNINDIYDDYEESDFEPNYFDDFLDL